MTTTDVLSLTNRQWTLLLRDNGTLEPGVYRITDTPSIEVREVTDGPAAFRAPTGRLWHRTRVRHVVIDHDVPGGEYVWWVRHPERMPIDRAQAWCGLRAHAYACDDLPMQYSDDRPAPHKACRFCWPACGGAV